MLPHGEANMLDVWGTRCNQLDRQQPWPAAPRCQANAAAPDRSAAGCLRERPGRLHPHGQQRDPQPVQTTAQSRPGHVCVPAPGRQRSRPVPGYTTVSSTSESSTPCRASVMEDY